MNPLDRVTPQCVVALTWTLRDTLGEALDVLEEPVEFLVGGDDLLPKIEEALQGCAVDAALIVHLEPEQAFGDYQEQLVFLERRALFPKDLEEGIVFQAQGLPEGISAEVPRSGLFTVTEIYPEHVVLDGNHPLAGIALRLHVKIAAVRAATAEEISGRTAGTAFFKTEQQAPGGSLLH